MKAKDVMTSPVVSIEPDASIWQPSGSCCNGAHQRLT
jgi:hypothetical protein